MCDRMLAHVTPRAAPSNLGHSQHTEAPQLLRYSVAVTPPST
ncbi:hypothetical protein SAMN06295900_12331 [Trinickia caryophylli]|uniref:Uncharacterized protein n=1 Tax=Trinickia caryophylli TaxID=28094 RepID=A0A1X7H8M2_TRICW|nr:hypothetical protein SAMN06295900_12331 [Trinickia caryophylli]